MKLKSIGSIFKSLNEAGVKYLLAGGLAVVAHGYMRFTADVDLILGMDEKNLINAMHVFESLGYVPRAPVELGDFISYDNRCQWMEEKGLTVFSLWNPDDPATEVDIFVECPLDFEKAYLEGEDFDIMDGVTAKVLCLRDLISLKSQAGRPLDLDDICKLNAIHGARQKSDG